MEYRSESFSVEGIGGYIVIHQRPGELVRLDINFFDGDRTIVQSIHRVELLIKAIEKAKEWIAETIKESSNEKP